MQPAVVFGEDDTRTGLANFGCSDTIDSRGDR